MTTEVKEPLVSIVIRCYNEREYIGLALNGIMSQSHRNFEMIVVDSGSTDGTVEVIKGYPVQLLTIRPDEFSFGRSLNIGCAAAKGEFILIASAHVYPVYRDWITRMIGPFSDPKVALTYGQQRGTSASKYSERRVLARWFSETSNHVQEHPFCNNANSAIRRELWSRIPYDEELTGLEDLDWAKRAMELGYHVAYSAQATVVHNHNESPSRIFNRYKREAIALKKIFPNERMSIWDASRLFLGNTVSDYYHAAKDGLLMRNLVSIPIFRAMQFWGAWNGFLRPEPLTNALRRKFYYPTGHHYPTGPTVQRGPDGGRDGGVIDYGIDPDTKTSSAGKHDRSV